MQAARTRGGYMLAKVDVLAPRAGNAPIIRTGTPDGLKAALAESRAYVDQLVAANERR
jgi:hypothetical protein